MKRATAFLLLLASLLFPQARKGKAPRPPEVELLEVTARRETGQVILDGRVRNATNRPFKGLIVLFEFHSTDGRMISRKQTTVAEDSFDPGQEGEFRTETPDPVRAVRVLVICEDREGRYLRVDKPGPFPIE